MKHINLFIVITTLLLWGSTAFGAVVAKTISYQENGVCLQGYLAAMNASDLNWEIIIYGNAKHSFTNPGADRHSMAALAYNPTADRRSWENMKQFFNEIFSN